MLAALLIASPSSYTPPAVPAPGFVPVIHKSALNEPDPVPITCSCIKTARAEGIEIPYNTDAIDLKGNTVPQVNALALFMYDGLAHVAKITQVVENGFYIVEGNFKHCLRTKRFISWNDPNLTGFWKNEV